MERARSRPAELRGASSSVSIKTQFICTSPEATSKRPSLPLLEGKAEVPLLPCSGLTAKSSSLPLHAGAEGAAVDCVHPPEEK